METKELLYSYFQKICSIPHPSNHIDRISDYLLAECRRLGYEAYQDEVKNVICIAPATPGFENAPTVMLQGHMDMVPAKDSESHHNFETDPIEVILEGDRIHANHTTLGADDGVAVVYMLSLLADPTIAHPALEMVFTVNEETGMDGAVGLDCSSFQAKYLINMDHGDEGSFIVSCAGGSRFDAHFPLNRVEKSGIRTELTVHTRLGGHSGGAIHLERPNANVVMGDVLLALSEKQPFSIVSIDGGRLDNAIPTLTKAVLLSDAPLDVSAIEKAEKTEYAETDDELWLETKILSANDTKKVWSKDDTYRILRFMECMPNGVINVSHKLPNLVETSLNRGIVETTEEGIDIRASVRSSRSSRKEKMNRRLVDLAVSFGGTGTISGSYPGWAYSEHSPLREKAEEVWNEMHPEKKAYSFAIHAGLECGLLLEKMPELDIISCGPNMRDIHTPEEELSYASFVRVFEWLKVLLTRLS